MTGISRYFIKKQWIGYFVLILILVLFSLYFLSTTSPLFDNVYGQDSAYYRFIGLSILNNKTPYLDIWENKGPVFYFIQALGALNGTQNSKLSFIFPIQVLALLTSVFFLERSDRLFNHDIQKRLTHFILIIVLCLPFLATTLERGNLTEEWSLPMICCSIYYFSKYADKTNNKSADACMLHPRFYAFIYGVCFALTAFIRINNAITICAGILVIGITLIKHKLWKNIIENIIFGVMGSLIVVIPVFLWCASRNALWEMLYACFIHGFKYAEIIAHEPFSDRNLIIRYLPFILCLFLIFLKFLKSREFNSGDGFILAIAASNIFLLFRQNTFLHYYVILFPVIIFIITAYMKTLKIPAFILLIAFAAFYIQDCRSNLRGTFNKNTYKYFPTAEQYLPKSERTSLIAIDSYPEIYLLKGTFPISRFAAYQTNLFKIEPKFKDEFITDLQEKNPIWIVTNCKDIRIPEIQNIIDLNYSINFTDTLNLHCFYRINE